MYNKQKASVDEFEVTKGLCCAQRLVGVNQINPKMELGDQLRIQRKVVVLFGSWLWVKSLTGGIYVWYLNWCDRDFQVDVWFGDPSSRKPRSQF